LEWKEKKKLKKIQSEIAKEFFRFIHSHISGFILASSYGFWAFLFLSALAWFVLIRIIE